MRLPTVQRAVDAALPLVRDNVVETDRRGRLPGEVVDVMDLVARIAGVDGVDPVPRVVFVETAAPRIEETWDSSGLRGTGSHHVSVRDLEIDGDHHWCTPNDRTWPEGTLWRLPLLTVFVPLLASVPLGIARGALDHIGRLVCEGRTARRGQLVDDPVAMGEFAVAGRSDRVSWVSGRSGRSRRTPRSARHRRPVGRPACGCSPGPGR